MKPRILFVAAAFVVCATAIRSESQRPSAAPQVPRAADTVLPGPPESISLDLPANVFSAYAAFHRVLDAAGIRYGLEGIAWDPSVPPIDLARLRESSVPLAGRRLGDALDAIVKAAPQFRWTEINGVIVVRAADPAQNLLDRKVPRFMLTDAPPRVALETLIRAIDPARPPGFGIIGFGRPGAGAGGGPARIGRNVTLTLTNETVQNILASIARLNGELAWTIQYDRAPASTDTATIVFTELGVTVTAQSPATFKDSIASTPATQRMPISSSVATMLSSYSTRSGARISVEEIGLTTSEAQTLLSRAADGVPPIELPDNPALAIARIVALDSRYEVSEKNGRFHVRPKTGVPGRLDLLDKSVDGFTATNEAARTVIERLGRLIGSTRPMSIGPSVAARGPSPVDTAMATPISVTLTGQVTPRDVLDAIADATGWSWSLRPIFLPGQSTQLSLQWRGASASPGRSAAAGAVGGWISSIVITMPSDLSPAPMPSHPPVRAIPASLDREIPQMQLSVDTVPDAFQQLATSTRLPLATEDAPPVALSADPRRMTRPKPPITVGPGKFSDALYVLLERLEYEIVSTDGTVNVAPTSLVRSRDYFMSRPLDTFSVTNVGLVRAVGELRRALDPKFEPSDWTRDGGDIMNRRVSLSVTKTSPREILNRLVREHGNITWASGFAPHPGAYRADATIDDWFVTLTPTAAPGPIVSVSVRGVTPASAVQSLLSQPMRGPVVPSHGVLLNLPVTSISLRAALGSIGRVSGTPAGFETVATSTPTPPFTPPDYYDLSGLEGPQLVEKLKALAPEYDFALTDGIFHIRPRIAQSESTPWLEQRIDRFEQRFENLRDAMNAVVMLPRVPWGPGGRGAAPAPPPNSGLAPPTPPAPATSTGMSSVQERTQKTLVISLTNVTARQILDEIARQFGRVMWTVDQRTSSQGMTSLSLTFTGYDGWTMGTTIR